MTKKTEVIQNLDRFLTISTPNPTRQVAIATRRFFELLPEDLEDQVEFEFAESGDFCITCELSKGYFDAILSCPFGVPVIHFSYQNRECRIKGYFDFRDQISPLLLEIIRTAIKE